MRENDRGGSHSSASENWAAYEMGRSPLQGSPQVTPARVAARGSHGSPWVPFGREACIALSPHATRGTQLTSGTRRDRGSLGSRGSCFRPGGACSPAGVPRVPYSDVSDTLNSTRKHCCSPWVPLGPLFSQRRPRPGGSINNNKGRGFSDIFEVGCRGTSPLPPPCLTYGPGSGDVPHLDVPHIPRTPQKPSHYHQTTHLIMVRLVSRARPGHWGTLGPGSRR
jgi:hypothetical protein